MRDAIAMAGILGFALLMMLHTGSRRGAEFMPWPDGLEYAAMTVNLAHGLGPVLHFGGYSYPSRYPAGYQLMIAALVPHAIGISRAYAVTIAIGLMAIAALFTLARRMFDLQCATVAALVLATSPIFIAYSTLVLSDVPATLLAIAAAGLLFAIGAEEDREPRRPRVAILLWAAFGLAAGYAVAIRPTNAAMLAGLALGFTMVRPPRESIAKLIKPLGASAAAFALPVAWLVRNNAVYLGGAFRSGYAWWVSEVYGAGGAGFSTAYLFGPTMPRNPHGNVIVYASALLGVDGMLGDRGDARYFLYPVAAAAFAIIGIAAIMRAPARRSARRVVWFGIGFLAALTAIYSVHVFTDVVFLMPACFVMFLGAGYGATIANHWMLARFGMRRNNAGHVAGVFGVIVLDAILAFAIGAEAVARLSAPPQGSAMVAALAQVDAQLPPGATVASNISLQFLQLYIPGAERRFIGLNSRDPGERFTDYHLSRLFVKRSQGWTGPIPPTIFVSDSISPDAEKLLAASARTSAGAYLILCAPESREYATVLKDEIARLSADFDLTPIAENRSLAVFRLAPH
ncbi:MAG TPA: glycosyltransferase family 39 protein [Candidatus Binataceae bacterium]|nr:glycosyltransferase family 39 protein [Candidatus Binataceae bacterium]